MPYEIASVLIVEDDPDTRENLSDILKLDGYQVDQATDAGSASVILATNSYTVVILDRELPDGNANEILPKLKALTQKTSFVIATGHAELNCSIAAPSDGAIDYLPKPFNADQLRASVARIVRTHTAEKRAEDAERLATIGQMVAGIAHESRNALQRIHANVDTLKLDFLDASDSESLATMSRIEQAADSLGYLLNEVREFAAPIVLQRKETNLQTVWRRAWNNINYGKHDWAARFEENLWGCDLHANVDAFRMEQVFRNLFDNSIAACNESPSIKIVAVPSLVDDKDFLQIAIRDNGKGIDPSDRQRVFEPFFTTKQKGTGLGMSIVKRVVEAHGGSIRIGKQQNPGAEFIVSLPRSVSLEKNRRTPDESPSQSMDSDERSPASDRNHSDRDATVLFEDALFTGSKESIHSAVEVLQ